jgi:HEPN domain-containing protein
MNREHLQELTQMRLEEANLLLGNNHFSAAYYLAGYVIECALKACIAKQTREHDFPPPPGEIHDIYTHALHRLAESAGLDEALSEETRSNVEFAASWAVVDRWDAESRYEIVPEPRARELWVAITDEESGVLPWLQERW